MFFQNVEMFVFGFTYDFVTNFPLKYTKQKTLNFHIDLEQYKSKFGWSDDPKRL